jgi:hypothetical protein
VLLILVTVHYAGFEESSWLTALENWMLHICGIKKGFSALFSVALKDGKYFY